jgi:hypothetical protein
MTMHGITNLSDRRSIVLLLFLVQVLMCILLIGIVVGIIFL